MDSPKSARGSESEQEEQLEMKQTLSARPTVKRTYGKPRAEREAFLQADESFTSDLTSLSQLSQAPPASSNPAEKAGAVNEDEEDSDKEILDSGYQGQSKSIADLLKDIDDEFDAEPEVDSVKVASLPAAKPPPTAATPAEDAQMAVEKQQPQEQEDPAQKRERVVSGASSSSTNEVHGIGQPLASTSSPRQHRTSPPTSPRQHAILRSSDNEEEEEAESERPFHSRRSSSKPSRKILDSDDDDEDEAVTPLPSRKASPSPQKSSFRSRSKHSKVIDSDDEEEELNSRQVRKQDIDSDNDLPSVKDAVKALKNKKQESASEDEEAETQRTEDIELFPESQVYQSNRLSASPEGKRKSKEKKKRPPTKKDEEDARRVAEQSRRNRHASIMPRSRPARPLSEISQRLQGTDPSARPLSSLRPSMPHRPRSAPTKPALSLRAASVPFSSLRPTAPMKSETKPIEIGSSSGIYDFNMEEDSYDPSYLKADTQSETQDSLETEKKPLHATLKAGTSPIQDINEDRDDDDDEDLPDVAQVMQERLAKEAKAKALQAKKAALLARQQDKAEERKRVVEDPKGKGREIVMDLDSDPEELEIVVHRAETPIIKAAHHSPRSHKLMRQLAGRSIKKEHDDDVSESQVRRAGRSFGVGEAKVVVAPHVAMKAGRAQAAKKNEHAVTSEGVYNLLIEKARQQAINEKVKRMDDWKRRGGTLRHEGALEELAGNIEDEETHDERAKHLLSAIQAGADKGQADEDEDDDENDEDYNGSDEEAALYSGDEVGSADEADLIGDQASEDEEGEQNLQAKVRKADMDLDEPDLEAELSSIATTQVIPSDPTADMDNGSEESEEEIVVTTKRVVPKKKAVLEDDEDDSSSQRHFTQAGDATHATQYHDFVVRDAAPAFPEFDNNEMKEISLTQVFGEAGATQAVPQASRAVFEDAEGFSQLFGDDEDGTFTQGVAATQIGNPAKSDAPMPSMFRQDKDGSPQLQRHAFGEAPMLLDAALRDAQIREEADRAYDQIRFERSRDLQQIPELDPTRTPGSTLSEEMPPLPPVTMSVERYNDREMSLDRATSSEGEDSDAPRMGLNDTPTVPRRLRRAGGEAGSSASPERPRNAFDALKAAQLKKERSNDKEKERKKAKKSAFIAEEVEESEDEGEYSMLRKLQDEGDDEDGSDLDATVEELVDDQKGDPDEEEQQDDLAEEKHRAWQAEQESRNLKLAQKVADGKMKKRRADGAELDDSDYEDDIMHREAKAKKAKQYSSKMEALNDNPETQSFAKAGMDDGTNDINGDFLIQAEPTSEGVSDEEHDSDMEGAPAYRSSRHYDPMDSYAMSRQDEMHMLNKVIYGVPSSPQQELYVEDTLTTFASRTVVKANTAMEAFDDIDQTYTEVKTLKRRVVQFEKDESQNEHGRGPGRTSAVTSFARKQSSTTSTAQASSVQKTSVQTTSILSKKTKPAGRPILEIGNRGRLAAARSSKR